MKARLIMMAALLTTVLYIVCTVIGSIIAMSSKLRELVAP